MSDMDLSQVDTAMDEWWRMHPSKAQFHRIGETSKWFRPRGEVMKGKRWHFKAYTQPLTGVRSSDWDTAAAIDKEFPTPRQIAYTNLSYARTDLTMFQLSLSINELADDQTENQDHSVYRLVQKLFRETDADMGHKFNLSIHQSSAAKMGSVAQILAVGGGAYSTAQTGFIQIIDVQVGKFLPGEVLDIGSVSDVTVMDVIVTKDGPWSGGVVPVKNVGPGITVDAGGGNNLDSISVDDAIRRSDETTGDGMQGFADWFNGNKNVYKDEDGSALNRDLAGNGWQIPTVVIVAADGAEVTFDLDAHLGLLADTLPQAVKTGRNDRAADNDEEDIIFPSNLTAIVPIDLSNSVLQEAESSARFTKTIDMTKDVKAELFGQVSFDGIVWHSATLPPIAFQADGAAAKFRLRLIDPQSWGYLNFNSGGKAQFGINWTKTGGAAGTRWTRKPGTNGLNTFQLVAGAWAAALMFCDQPQANAEIRGIKPYR